MSGFFGAVMSGEPGARAGKGVPFRDKAAHRGLVILPPVKVDAA
jgi:hypothetical protein